MRLEMSKYDIKWKDKLEGVTGLMVPTSEGVANVGLDTYAGIRLNDLLQRWGEGAYGFILSYAHAIATDYLMFGGRVKYTEEITDPNEVILTVTIKTIPTMYFPARIPLSKSC